MISAIGVSMMIGIPSAMAQPPPDTIAEGVSIGGRDVSGLTRDEARRVILRELVAPKRHAIPVAFRGRFLRLEPVAAGYVAKVDYALKGALNFGRSRPAQTIDVPLKERIRADRIRQILRWYNARFATAPVEATVRFDDGRPHVTPARAGVEIDLASGVRRVAQAILVRDQRRYRLPVVRVRPESRRIGFSIVVDREAFDLRLFKGERLMRTMTVAVGMPGHPTPEGRFEMTRLDRNPVWYPPDSRWAEGLGPVEPGRGNPLGTRWMGISSPAIGIHGTPPPETLGTAASHGCVRLSITNAEWLFNLVERGTPVKII
ncbi:MAG: L,D-transpeptidase family protein [Thermoleophilia bacterium]|nr:L,D-transpeptidase family protein [Thermoleophilia bacterium]